jgi:hypothetical protein
MMRSRRRWFHASEDRVFPLAAPALHGGDAGDDVAGGGRQVAAQLDRTIRTTERITLMNLKRIVWALASLAALVMAVGASWRPF